MATEIITQIWKDIETFGLWFNSTNMNLISSWVVGGEVFYLFLFFLLANEICTVAATEKFHRRDKINYKLSIIYVAIWPNFVLVVFLLTKKDIYCRLVQNFINSIFPRKISMMRREFYRVSVNLTTWRYTRIKRIAPYNNEKENKL